MHPPPLSKVFRSDLLEGQVALVTGGGTGIGAATARELARLGATVIIGSRKASHIEPAAAGLSAELGVPVEGVILDITARKAADAARALLQAARDAVAATAPPAPEAAR